MLAARVVLNILKVAFAAAIELPLVVELVVLVVGGLLTVLVGRLVLGEFTLFIRLP